MLDLTLSSSHFSVLLPEVLKTLHPKDNETYVDGTFGVGGYTQAFLEAAHCCVIAIDRDPEAAQRSIAFKTRYGDRFQFIQGRFGDMENLLAAHSIQSVDGIVLDLGVSSPQLDRAERGFSFKKEGPLDMRMGSSSLSAADVVNTYDEETLASIIFQYGEEKNSRRIARRIVQRRSEKEFQTTQELADLIRETVPFQRKGHDPATRTFQALRIYVNDELGELEKALGASENFLKEGGRLVIVTFHSLEDRLVKNFIRAKSGLDKATSRHLPQSLSTTATFKPLTKKPLTPSEEELQANPRSRSAKLRAALRVHASQNGEHHD